MERAIEINPGAYAHVRCAGTGPTVVWLHGVAHDGRDWDGLADRIEGVRSVIPDLRGHGRSTARPPYDVDRLGEDVAALLHALGCEQPPVLVGHSLGGAVAAVYASRHPVRAVLNVDQPMQLELFATHVQPREPELRGGKLPVVLKELVRGLGVDALSAEQVAIIDAHREAVDPEVVLGAWDALLRSSPGQLAADGQALMRRIRAPYTELHGREPGPAYRRWLRSVLPHARLEVWDGHGHFPHWVDPGRFRRFVRQHVVPPA